MGDPDRVALAAERLWEAESSRTAIAPLTDDDPTLTVEDAYAIQRTNIERSLASGARVVGWKVGLTSKAMQQMLGVDEPDFGVLLSGMVLDDSDPIAVGRLLQPRVEAEIGFVLGRDLEGPDVTTMQALAAIDVAVPALEVIDSRIREWRIKLVDTIADNGSSAMAVVGPRQTPVAGVDLRLVGVAVSRNGELVEHGAGAAVLGHPARCVAWLANKLASFGERLEAGQFVLPGSLHRAFEVLSGDVVEAEFGGLGSVRARFVEGVGR